MDFPKIPCKSTTALLFVASLVFLSIIFVTFDLRSHFPAIPFQIYSSLPACSRPFPLRLYMYDLDRRFNFDMLDRRAGGPRPDPAAVSTWPQNSGVKRQHSVEYWMMASLMYGGGGTEEMDAVRVSDPDAADAFFVPFFSSLSFNVHGRNMTDPATEGDRKLQRVEFFKGVVNYED